MAARTGVLYPAFLDLQNVQVLVVGAGDVAARKVASLLEAGARVRVVSPVIHPEIAARAGAGLSIERRPYRPGDLRGARLVFAATNLPDLNRSIAAAARKAGAWVNVAAPPDEGDLVVPGTLRRGPVTLAVGTGGSSAALTRALRELLERTVGPEWGQCAELLESRRAKAMESIQDPARRRALLIRLGQPMFVRLIRREGVAAAGRCMDKVLATAARLDASARRRAERTAVREAEERCAPNTESAPPRKTAKATPARQTSKRQTRKAGRA